MLEIAISARRGNFSLNIEAGFASDWTVIFGPSGSGKSTMLRLLAGLDRALAQSARIAFNGRRLTDTSTQLWLRPGHRGTALVTQQPALFPHLSVAENVAYGVSRLDRSARSSRVSEILDLVEARQLMSRYPSSLSGGEGQRVALARALAPAPRLLLLDEPFSALDGSTSDALLDRLRQWVREHRVQAVIATHDATDAFATGAEVALLRDGRLEALGPAAQALRQERDRLLNRLSE